MKDVKNIEVIFENSDSVNLNPSDVCIGIYSGRCENFTEVDSLSESLVNNDNMAVYLSIRNPEQYKTIFQKEFGYNQESLLNRKYKDIAYIEIEYVSTKKSIKIDIPWHQDDIFDNRFQKNYISKSEGYNQIIYYINGTQDKNLSFNNIFGFSGKWKELN